MSKIRKFAKSVGHEVVGNLFRAVRFYPADTVDKNSLVDNRSSDRLYLDAAGNEYWLAKDGSVCIVTAEGAVY